MQNPNLELMESNWNTEVYFMVPSSIITCTNIFFERESIVVIFYLPYSNSESPID